MYNFVMEILKAVANHILNVILYVVSNMASADVLGCI
jgi:hypothetical protein